MSPKITVGPSEGSERALEAQELNGGERYPGARVRDDHTKAAEVEVGDDRRPPGVVGGDASEVDQVVTGDGDAGQQRHAPPAVGRPPAARHQEPVATSDRQTAKVDGDQLVAARLRGVLHHRGAFVVSPCLLDADDIGVERLDRGDDIERASVRAETSVSVEGGDGE